MKRILKNSTIFLLCTSIGIQPIAENRVYGSSINSNIQLESSSEIDIEENALTESSKEEEKEVPIEPIQSTEKESAQELETEENIEKRENEVVEETKEELEKENEGKEEQVQENVQEETKEKLEITSNKTQQLDNETKIEKKRVVREQAETIENTPIDIEHINMAELEAMDTETLIVRWNATLLGKPLSNQQLEDVKQTLTKKDDPYKEGGDKTLEQALRNQALEYFQRLVTLQTLDTDTMDLKELLIMEEEAWYRWAIVIGYPSKDQIVEYVENRLNKLKSYTGVWDDETCEEYLRKEVKSFFAELWKSIVASKNIDVKAVTLETMKEYLEGSFPAEQVAEYIKSEEQKWEKDLNIYRTDMALDITELEFKNLSAYFNYLPTSTFLRDFRAKQDMKDKAKEEEYKTKPVIFGSKYIERDMYRKIGSEIIPDGGILTMELVDKFNKQLIEKGLEEGASYLFPIEYTDDREFRDKNVERITSLQGLEYFTCIDKIAIGNSTVYKEGISPLLSQLEKYPEYKEGYKNGSYYSQSEIMFDIDTFYGITDLSPLRTLKNLRSLELYHTKVSSIEPLEELTNLETLIIYDSELTSCKALKNLTKLKHLTIACSPLESLEGIEHLTNLETLEIWDTKITSIEPVRNLKNLKKLDLGGSDGRMKVEDYDGVRIESVELIDSVDEPAIMNKLGVWMNQFRKYRMQGVCNLEPLSELTQIEYLDLAHNQVKDLTPLKNLVNIRYLNLAHNQIEDLSPLASLTKLSGEVPETEEHKEFQYGVLNLDNNRLKSLKGLPNGKWLVVRAEHNELEELSPNVKAKHWRLSHNRLTSESLMTLSQVAKDCPIESLTLRNNRITDLNFMKNGMFLLYLRPPFVSVICPGYLDLSYNQITDIEPMKTCQKGETYQEGNIYFSYLNLSHNEIESLKELKLKTATLDVSYNKLTRIDLGQGSNITYNLNCQNNQLTSLDEFKEKIVFGNGGFQTSYGEIFGVSMSYDFFYANLNCQNNQIEDLSPILQVKNPYQVLLFGGNKIKDMPFVPRVKEGNKTMMDNVEYAEKLEYIELPDIELFCSFNLFFGVGMAQEYQIGGEENQHVRLEEQKMQDTESRTIFVLNTANIEENALAGLYDLFQKEDLNQKPTIQFEQAEGGKCELIYDEKTGDILLEVSDVTKSHVQKVTVTYQYRADKTSKYRYYIKDAHLGWDFEIPIILVDENGKEITQGDLEFKAIDKQTKEGVVGAKIHILKQGETIPLLTGTTDQTGNFVQDVVKTKSGSQEQSWIELEAGTYEYMEVETPKGYQPTTEKGSFTIQNGEKTTVILEKEKIVSSVDQEPTDKEESPTTEEKNPVLDPKEIPEEVPLEENSVPTLQLDYEKEWTNQDIVVKIAAKDEVGLKHLVLPNGKEQPVDMEQPKHMEYEYTVKESGNYTFVAANKQDKTASETMTAKIDKVKPIGKVVERNDEYHITATDDASGVSHMIDPDGKRIDWSKHYEISGFDTKKSGMYTIYDRAGNKTELDVKDTVPPTLTLTYQKGWIKGKSNIAIVAKDEKEMGYLELPIGNKIKPNDGNKKEIIYQYVVQESGNYKFIAVDQGGNQTVETATIQIDNIAPKVTIQQGQKQIFLYAADQESGVAYVITPSNKKIQWKEEYNTTGIPIHEYGTYIVCDKVGNEGYGQLQLEDSKEEGERPYTKEVTKEPEEQNSSNKEEPEVTITSNIPETSKQKPNLGYLYRNLGGDLDRIEIPEEQYKLLTLGARVSGEDIGRKDIQTIYMDKKGNVIIIGTDGEQYETFVPKTGDNIHKYGILSFGGGLILFLFWRRNRKKILK